MNSLFNQLNGNQPNNMDILKLLRSGANPMELITSMAATDPSAQQLLNEINSCNGDFKSLFFKKAKQMNKNPNEILSRLK